MFHNVLAEEVKDNPSIFILNYSPGPMDTDMQREIRENVNIDPEMKARFNKMRNKLLNPITSARKLTQILLMDNYIELNGEHVDYFDDIGQGEKLSTNR